MNKHTKGPWRIGDAGTAVFGPRKTDNSLPKTIAKLHNRPISTPEDYANAQLISAAPELLEIAKAYRNLLKTMAQTDGEVATFHHIQSVIAKAEGSEK